MSNAKHRLEKPKKSKSPKKPKYETFPVPKPRGMTHRKYCKLYRDMVCPDFSIPPFNPIADLYAYIVLSPMYLGIIFSNIFWVLGHIFPPFISIATGVSRLFRRSR